jgi:hypothetical protein
MSTSAYDEYGFERKDFCECYARAWGRAYKDIKVPLTASVRVNIRASSLGYCSYKAGTEAEKRRVSENKAE